MADSKNIIVWDGREWQRTGGKYYILRADYKHRTGEMLHRAIWKKHFGEIPKGYVIHHIDHNPDNNDISNLECISNREHCQRHMREPERIAKSKETLKNITIPKLEEWRKSEAGQKRLKEYGQRLAQYQAEHLIDAICKECGQPFKMHPTRGTGLCRKCGKRAVAKRHYEQKKQAKGLQS